MRLLRLPHVRRRDDRAMFGQTPRWWAMLQGMRLARPSPGRLINDPELRAGEVNARKIKDIVD